MLSLTVANVVAVCGRALRRYSIYSDTNGAECRSDGGRFRFFYYLCTSERLKPKAMSVTHPYQDEFWNRRDYLFIDSLGKRGRMTVIFIYYIMCTYV